MKTSQILYYVIFLLAGSVGGYLIGSRSSKSAANTTSEISSSTPEKETPASATPAAENEPTAPAETADAPPSADAPATSPAPAATPATTTPASRPATAAPASTASAPPASVGSLPSASQCFTGDKELEDDLTLYASQIEALKLMYSHELKQDCSGIFYRLLDEFAKKKCSNAAYPDPNIAGRPARMIVKWFHDNKNLVIVNDPMFSRNLIKPGAVMFYGKPGAKYNNPTIERLSAQGGVFHVGVVTSVTRDADGNVIQYTLFHGRSTGKIASRTYYHHVRGPSNLGQPILGVGSEEWVGVGYLFTPKV